MNDSEIQMILETYPDKVAEALGKFKTATVDRERLAAKLFLKIKAEAETNKEKMPIDEIKARVRADETHYRACLDEIIAESEYTAVYEKLLAAKRESGMRAAF